MQGNRILYVLILLTAGGHIAYARLGESPQAIEQRYGRPLSSVSLTDFTRSVYEKQSFAITVFYRNGVSVLETFARRGLDQVTARKVVIQVAARSIGCPDGTQESQIRHASGITSRDEVFWIWTTPAFPMNAAFNPIDCTLSFFSQPALYASIHQALESAPPLEP
jgi:hypothetical protein